MNVYPWMKKDRLIHLYEAGKSETLCGKPMLGSNYSIHPNLDGVDCMECIRQRAQQENQKE